MRAIAAFVSLLGAGLGHLGAGRFLAGVLLLVVDAMCWGGAVWSAFAERVVAMLGFVAACALVRVGSALEVLRRPLTTPRRQALVVWAASVGAVVVQWIAITGRVIEPFSVEDSSMVPTMIHGDHVLIDRRAGQAIHRGVVVVVRTPDVPSRDLGARVIGVAGDTVSWRGGRLFLNDVALSSPLDFAPGKLRVFDPDSGLREVSCVFGREVIGDRHYSIVATGVIPLENAGRVLIPEGHYYVVGDERSFGNDSRRFGPVPESSVKGRVMYVYGSWGPYGVISARMGHPIR